MTTSLAGPLLAEVADYRRRSGLTLQELADGAQVTEGMWSHVQRGKRMPGLRVLAGLVDLIDNETILDYLRQLRDTPRQKGMPAVTSGGRATQMKPVAVYSRSQQLTSSQA